MEIIPTIASVAGGSLTGLIGTFAGRAFAFFERRQEHKFQQKKWLEDEKQRAFDERQSDREYKHELKLHEMNRKAANEEFERDVVMQEHQTSRAGLIASTEDQQALSRRNGGSLWVIDTLRLVRPVLTLLAMVLLAVLFYFVEPEVRAVVVNSIIYIAVTSYVWWFGERAPERMKKYMFKEQ